MASAVDLRLNTAMDASLSHFFSSIESGNISSTFLQRWSSLNDTVQSYRDDLAEETLTNAHNLAMTIEIITSGMLELDRSREIVHTQLIKDFSLILNDGTDSTPPYIKPCSQWLLSNLHNPYPSKSVRISISRQTRTNTKDLDAWFTDARKRIGWNHLRRTHFSNRRETIIDAATSFFKHSPLFLKADIHREFPVEPDYSMAFVEMEECAQRLFSDKFKETHLAAAIEREVHASQMENQNNSTNHQTHTPIKCKPTAYPSPECSPGQSPEPLPPSSVVLDPLPFLTASQKRRRSSPDACTDYADADRPQKRIRQNDAPNFDDALAAASLPSPTASLKDVSSPAGVPSLPLGKVTPSAPPASTLPSHCTMRNSSFTLPIRSSKRKRSSSDSEDRRPSKYLEPASLSRIASDPHPFRSQFTDICTSEDPFSGCVHNQLLLLPTPPPSGNELANGSVTSDANYYQYIVPPLMPNHSLKSMATLQDSSTRAQKAAGSQTTSELDAWAQGQQEYEFHDLMMAENSIYTNDLEPLILEPDFFTGLPALDKFFDPNAFDWTGYINQPLNTQIASQVELGTVFSDPSSVLPSPSNCPSTELDAKRQRAEALRAELRQLEADLD
uniref:Homeodomain protein n=1 Tax=Pholiota microspora TaxID=1538424 RepID=B9A1R1_PHOMI|nr:homeodomain protein [Pholiota nameko]